MNSSQKKQVSLSYCQAQASREEDVALKLYESSFGAKKSLMAKPMIFVKGGTYDATTKTMDESKKNELYMPTNERLDKRQPSKEA